MNETNEMWREVHEQQKLRRRSKRDFARHTLNDYVRVHGLTVCWYTPYHVRVTYKNRKLDFWPSTGVIRTNGETLRGKIAADVLTILEVRS